MIAIEVFGRPPDYNPKQDAVVRIEAGRLRARLAEYYQGGGAGDPIVIELPKGGYVRHSARLKRARARTHRRRNAIVSRLPRLPAALQSWRRA